MSTAWRYDYQEEGKNAAHRKLNKLPALKQATLVAVERIP